MSAGKPSGLPPVPWSVQQRSVALGDTGDCDVMNEVVDANGKTIILFSDSDKDVALANAFATIPDLQLGLKNLRRDYVSLMEKGYERIIDLGGTCDPVERMTRDDPALRAVDAIIAKIGGGP